LLSALNMPSAERLPSLCVWQCVCMHAYTQTFTCSKISFFNITTLFFRVKE